MRLVSHVQTGEPFIIGLSREEARELSSAVDLVDDNRSLHRKHLAAVAMGGQRCRHSSSEAGSLMASFIEERGSSLGGDDGTNL
jgi:hypothetical protein